MKILLTNDDGIQSPVLPRLAAWIEKNLGEVATIAPKVEQSGKSHAIEFQRRIEIKRLELSSEHAAYFVDSTPADCVRFGVLGLKENFDLVISGINRGVNLGKDIVYSGTVGAIFEAARLGIPGVALSTDPQTFDAAMDRLDDILAFFRTHRLMELNTLYNVNIPLEYHGIRVTRQGGIYFTDEFVHRGDDMYEQIGHALEPDTDDLSVDIAAIKSGYVSVTPLTAEKTDMAVFDQLKQI